MSKENILREYGLTFTHHPMHEDLVNWGRWSSDKKGEPHAHCGSAEWRYKHPQDGFWERRDIQPQMVDVLSALSFEKIIVKLPQKYRLMLVGWYSKRQSMQAICCATGTRFAHFDQEMRKAINMVDNVKKKKNIS